MHSQNATTPITTISYENIKFSDAKIDLCDHSMNLSSHKKQTNYYLVVNGKRPHDASVICGY